MFLEKNRDRIEKDFEDFSRELPGKAEEIKKRMEALSPDIVIGMKYLYSNMPYSDVGNYTFDTYLDYVQQGIYLWENSPYVKNYPELYFLNYVLFHRTNDEEIKEIDAWIKQVRIDLKKNIIKKQNREINSKEIYSYMHDIFGAEIIDVFDLKEEEEQDQKKEEE